MTTENKRGQIEPNQSISVTIYTQMQLHHTPIPRQCQPIRRRNYSTPHLFSKESNKVLPPVNYLNLTPDMMFVCSMLYSVIKQIILTLHILSFVNFCSITTHLCLCSAILSLKQVTCCFASLLYVFNSSSCLSLYVLEMPAITS